MRVQTAQRAEQLAIRALNGKTDVGADRDRTGGSGGRVLRDGHGVRGDLWCHARHHVLAEGIRPRVGVAVGLAVCVILDVQVDLALAVVVGDRPERQRHFTPQVLDDELACFPERQGRRMRPCERGLHSPELRPEQRGGAMLHSRSRYLEPREPSGGSRPTREWTRPG